MASLGGLGGTNSNSGLDMINRYVDVNGEDYSAYVNRYEEEQKLKQLYEDKGTLDFQDMLQLMVAQFQNQTIDDQADTSDMMNQLVQMSTMQAMNEMVDHMEELRLANVMSYAASLVGKNVTVGVWREAEVLNDDGTITRMRKLEEIYGEVKGMGTYDGKQVIFLGDDYDMYYLSEILAVGEMPPKKSETPEEPEDPDAPTPPIEDNGKPDIDDDGNPIDTPTPPVEDSGKPDIDDDGNPIIPDENA